MKQLPDASPNVVRMNTTHASCEGFEELTVNVRTVPNRIAILMDMRGSEVRTTVPIEPIPLKVDDRVKVVDSPDQQTTCECISVSYPNSVHGLNVSGRILIDGDDLKLAVVDKDTDHLLCEVQNEVTLDSRKSVNIPRVRINSPLLTERDRNNIFHAIEKDMDFTAYPFVRNRQDTLDIQVISGAYGSDIKIITEIEDQEGVDDTGETLEAVDGIMTARGDSGIEVPRERIPGIQYVLIRKRILVEKPVIVITQALHTMIPSPRLTRTEVMDVVNVIYYRMDALMLSGEIAYSKYSVEAAKTTTKVAAQAEEDKLADNDIRIPSDEDSNGITASLVKQAVKATAKLEICAIITDSYSGRTTHNPAVLRGKYLAPAICHREETVRRLVLSHGVEAIYVPGLANGQEYYSAALRQLPQEGRLYSTDTVGYLSSGETDMQTSLLEISVVEDAPKHVQDSILPNSNGHL